MIGLCGFVLYACSKKTMKSYGRWILYFSLLFIVVLSAVRGKRLELVIALMPLLLVAWSTLILSIRRRILLFSLGIIVISSIASFRFGEFPDIANLFFNIFSEGIFAGHVFPGVLDALETGVINYEYGSRFAIAFLAFIPRFIFPGKDELVYKSLTDMSEFAPLGATSFLAEVYLQCGIISIVIFFVLLGFISKKIEIISFELRNSFFNLKIFVYLIFVCCFIPHFRDGIIPSIKISTQLFMMLLILFALSRLRKY